MHKYRTHNCSELSISNVSHIVKLSGWVQTKRDHGNLLFIDLRDNYGITQLVFNEVSQDLIDTASKIKPESVITIVGEVVLRETDNINNQISTGHIEIQVQKLIVESSCDNLPFGIIEEGLSAEDLRIEYRFLDLRRQKTHQNILLRSKIIARIRNLMEKEGFHEFQTPILTSSSPEGARDFLVPSRLHPGKFYALPQAPQQFKQLLMIAGFDKYFQIAPCFRDEDARKDRSPGEFYQLDIEMSFVTQEDIFLMMQRVLCALFSEFSSKSISSTNFPKITYEESMLKYGTDKPDLRNPLFARDVTGIFKNSNFTIFKKNIAAGQSVRAIGVNINSEVTRSFFDKMIKFAQENGANGLAYLQFDNSYQAKGPIAKLLTDEEIESITESVGRANTVFFVCDFNDKANVMVDLVRSKLAQDLGLIDPNIFEFCWITDFPYFEWDEDRKKIDFAHNPFSMPQGGDSVFKNAKTKADLLNIKSYQYDIVCNGIELSSGAIRNHLPSLMEEAFQIVGYNNEEIKEQFGGFIDAFKYGAPPHGGIAPGVDRIVMLLADTPNIREVIAFPMNQKAEHTLMKAPSTISAKQLEELHITIKPVLKK